MSLPSSTQAALSTILYCLRFRRRINRRHIQQIQAQIILNNLTSNTTVANHLVDACHSLGLLNSTAFPLYINNHRLIRPHTFTCNKLLRAFAHSETPRKARFVYTYMHKNSVPATNYTFPFILKVAADLKLCEDGKVVHSQVIKMGFLNDLYVGNGLLNLYCSIGDMGSCGKVFDEMPVRDVVSWTVVVAGFKDIGNFDDALITFESMREEGIMPNEVTTVNILAACAGYGALEFGVWVHDYIKRCCWELDVILGTALIDMYGSCGCIEEGIRVFDEMKERNLFTWNAVIKGLALSKNGKKAVEWFFRMEEEGVRPDEVTILSVLSACVHSGLVHMGRSIFTMLKANKYGFGPNVKHYACFVNLLVHGRCLDEAMRVIDEMPYEPTVSIWGAVLAGCREQGNLELGEVAALKLVELDPENSAYYTVLSNLYAETGRWSDVERVRMLMKERGLRKDIGSSAVQLENEELVASRRNRTLQTRNIYVEVELVFCYNGDFLNSFFSEEKNLQA